MSEIILGRPEAVNITTGLNLPNVSFYDVRRAPFEIYGLYEPQSEKPFKRLPKSIASETSPAVLRLSLQTAGGRVRFSTDSEYIAIKAVMPYVSRFAHMPLTGTTGFDLYMDSDAGSRYVKTFKPDPDIEGGYESVIKLDGRKMRHFTINFPSYNALDELYIGLESDATVGHGREYRTPLPVIFYGSSITQGACTSRPGLSYANMISRKYNLDYLNFGFSGNGRAEETIVRYMASLPMLAFVSDYDHNAPNVEYLRETHRRMYEIVREANPDIPYIMLSRPDFFCNAEESIARRDVIIDTFRYAREQGDKRAFYIDGEGIFKGPYEDSCTVDGTHPNDLGMMMIAESVGKLLERALRGHPFPSA